MAYTINAALSVSTPSFSGDRPSRLFTPVLVSDEGVLSVWRRKLEKKAQNDEKSSEMVGAAPIDGHRSLKIRAGRKVDSEEICPYAARDLAIRR